MGNSSENNIDENLGPDENLTIILSLDDGVELECEVITIFEVGEKEYIALYPISDNEEGEVYLYRYSESEDGEPVLDNIEDDDEYEAVADAFDELLDEEEFDEIAGEE